MNNDNAIKDKLNSLDTLDGGIVFGKDDAWRKLQSRMDAKPARKTKPLYWLAAAAALALLLLVAKLYMQPALQTTVAAPAAPPMPLTPEQPAEVPTSTEPIAKTKIIKKNNSRHSENRVPPQLIVPEPPQQVEQIVVVPPPAVAPAPTAPQQPRPMRIVHLSELDKDITAIAAENEPEQPNTALTEIMKLPPVHINDILHEDYYLQELRRENRLTVGGVSIYFNSPQKSFSPNPPMNSGLRLRIY